MCDVVHVLINLAQPRNRPPTSTCCSCHHAACTRPRWPPGLSNEAYLSSPHLSLAMNFRACSSPAPTWVKPQPAPAILSQGSVHTTLSITHHTGKRPSTGPRTTHGPHLFVLRLRTGIHLHIHVDLAPTRSVTTGSWFSNCISASGLLIVVGSWGSTSIEFYLSPLTEKSSTPSLSLYSLYPRI
jgi:hypothetical protein